MLTDDAPTEVLYADLQVAAASGALLHEISGLRHGGISLHPYVYVPGRTRSSYTTGKANST